MSDEVDEIIGDEGLTDAVVPQRVQPVDDLHHAGRLLCPEGRHMPGPTPRKDRLLRLPGLQLGTLPVDLLQQAAEALLGPGQCGVRRQIEGNEPVQ